ncbi:hypothetical protein BH11MYX2_BH11MYX2_22980 [soil metagenome]
MRTTLLAAAVLAAGCVTNSPEDVATELLQISFDKDCQGLTELYAPEVRTGTQCDPYGWPTLYDVAFQANQALDAGSEFGMYEDNTTYAWLRFPCSADPANGCGIDTLKDGRRWYLAVVDYPPAF